MKERKKERNKSEIRRKRQRVKEKGRWMDGSIDGETHRENLIDRDR